MTGARIRTVRLNRPDLRFAFTPAFRERAEGRRIVALGRRAKYLLAELSSGDHILMHLGMSGSFRIEDGIAAAPAFAHPRGKNAAHDHVVFELDSGEGAGDSAPTRVIYNDPRRFGFMLMLTARELQEHPLLRDLGPEPTGNRIDADWLGEAFAGMNRPLKAALLDQRLIAGLGNIYVCEALFRAGLSPRRKAGTLALRGPVARARRERLAEAIRTVIAQAIEAGGSSLRDHVRTDGSLGYFQHSFAVYDREGAPCPNPGCDGTVRRIVQSARSTFHCPRCQR